MLKAEAGTREDVVAFADIVVLAIPLYALADIDCDSLQGKLVIDVSNYHPDRDGPIPQLDRHQITTSEMVSEHFRGATVIKAFNAILAPDIDAVVRDGKSEPGRALPVAGNDPTAKAWVTDLHKEFGFVPHDAGGLEGSWRFERNKPAYCMRLTLAELIEKLAIAERETEVNGRPWEEGSIAR